MKFVVQSKAFYAAASAVSKVMASKNALLILDNFLLTISDGTLLLTASDTDSTMSARIEAIETEGQGKICLNARTMLNLLKELPDQEVTFNVNESNYEVEISYPGGTFNLIAISGAEFPEYKEHEQNGDAAVIETAGPRLAKGIDYTIFAVATEDFRAQMQGIYLDIFEDKLVFVATDTRKLVRYTDSNIQPGVRTSCILPPKAANVLRSVFGSSDVVKLEVGAKNAKVSNDTFTFQFSFMTGRYPDYNRVIPNNNPLLLTADRVAMLNVVRRVSIFVDAGYGLIKFRFTPDRMLLKASDSGMCTAGRDQMSCSFTGKELTIGFNAELIMGILNVLPGDEVLAQLSDPGRPGVFVPAVDAENTELVMLLMPMTVSEF